MSVLINTIHIITFCWVVSRVFAPMDAWRPKYLDSVSGIVAAISYLTISFDVILTPGLEEMAQTPSWVIFVLFLTTVGVCIGLTWMFIQVRVMVYEKEHLAAVVV